MHLRLRTQELQSRMQLMVCQQPSSPQVQGIALPLSNWHAPPLASNCVCLWCSVTAPNKPGFNVRPGSFERVPACTSPLGAPCTSSCGAGHPACLQVRVRGAPTLDGGFTCLVPSLPAALEAAGHHTVKVGGQGLGLGLEHCCGAKCTGCWQCGS
jgi:hypothetical protein